MIKIEVKELLYFKFCRLNVSIHLHTKVGFVLIKSTVIEICA